MKRSDIRSYFLNGLLEQNSTKCLTSGAIFETHITEKGISVKVGFPFNINIDESEAEVLENLIHNSLELALRPYFDAVEVKTDYPSE